MGDLGASDYSIQNFFALLEDDLNQLGVPELMDNATLAAACCADPPDVRRNLQRPLEVKGEDDDSDSDGEAGPSSKKVKTGNGAGPSLKSQKADKEKARRCKMNERFNDLAKLLELNQESKADKARILGEAIKYIHQVTVESNQLKQLNKFLEERVAHFERERGSNLYQRSLAIQQQGMQPHPQHAMPGQYQVPMQPSGESSQLLAGYDAQHGHHSHPAGHLPPQQHPYSAAGHTPSTSYMPPPAAGHPPSTGAYMPLPFMPPSNPTSTYHAYNAPAGPLKADFVDHGAVVPSESNPQTGNPWLNQQMLDSRQDSLLRPPAA